MMRAFDGWFIALVISLSQGICHAQWTPQTSGTRARLRGLCVVDRKVVWASGNSGIVVITINGGTT
jgi:hypothetical protein